MKILKHAGSHSMIPRCPKCLAQVDERAARCPACRWDFIAEGGSPLLSQAPSQSDEAAPEEKDSGTPRGDTFALSFITPCRLPAQEKSPQAVVWLKGGPAEEFKEGMFLAWKIKGRPAAAWIIGAAVAIGLASLVTIYPALRPAAVGTRGHASSFLPGGPDMRNPARIERAAIDPFHPELGPVKVPAGADITTIADAAGQAAAATTPAVPAGARGMPPSKILVPPPAKK